MYEGYDIDSCITSSADLLKKTKQRFSIIQQSTLSYTHMLRPPQTQQVQGHGWCWQVKRFVYMDARLATVSISQQNRSAEGQYFSVISPPVVERKVFPSWVHHPLAPHVSLESHTHKFYSITKCTVHNHSFPIWCSGVLMVSCLKGLLIAHWNKGSVALAYTQVSIYAFRKVHTQSTSATGAFTVALILKASLCHIQGCYSRK